MTDLEYCEQVIAQAMKSIVFCMDEIKEAMEQIVKSFMNSSFKAELEESREFVKLIKPKKPIHRTPYKAKCNSPFQQDKRVRNQRCRNTI